MNAMDFGEPDVDEPPMLGQTGGFGIRFAGRLIDWVLHLMLGFVGGVIGTIVAAVLAAVGVLGPDWLARTQEVGMGWNLFWGIVAASMYEVACEGIAGTSVGKLVLGYRVVTTDLRPCTPLKALMRSLAYYVDALFFGVVAYNAMSSSPLNQRLGDKWADTVVVKSAALPASARRSTGLVALGLLSGIAIHALAMACSVVLSAM